MCRVCSCDGGPRRPRTCLFLTMSGRSCLAGLSGLAGWEQQAREVAAWFSCLGRLAKVPTRRTARRVGGHRRGSAFYIFLIWRVKFTSPVVQNGRSSCLTYMAAQAAWSVCVRPHLLFWEPSPVQHRRSSCMKYMAAIPHSIFVLNLVESSWPGRWCNTEGQVAWSNRCDPTFYFSEF